MKSRPHIPDLDIMKSDYIRSEETYQRGAFLHQNDRCTLTSQDGARYRFSVEDRFDDFLVDVRLKEKGLRSSCSCGSANRACAHLAAALVALREMAGEAQEKPTGRGEAYTREEMMDRVIKERQERARTEPFRIRFGDNIYGFHEVLSGTGRCYSITIRDFERLNGYCSCPDFKTNKLGLCKHLLYARQQVRKKYPLEKLLARQSYPFVEIYCDPLKDYRITRFHKGNPDPELQRLLKPHFNGDTHLPPHRYEAFLKALEGLRARKKVLIRPEVPEKIEKHFHRRWLDDLSRTHLPDFSRFKLDLFDYQKEGVRFSLYKTGGIIADEMGLGKTLQAIAAAVLKKELFDFRRALVICPATLKHQWLKEIRRFTDEEAEIIEGPRTERHRMYTDSKAYFHIANYEAVMRDITLLRLHPPDLIILDEAQRIKNYATKTSQAVKAIPKTHALVITGTPIENRLDDLYSIMNFIDPEILAPLWEFSADHYYFDKGAKNKITGYFNLQGLKRRLSDVVIRREKKEVLQQLPDLQEVTVPVDLDPVQEEMHAGFARALQAILSKKHLTVYDMQRIRELLTCMRMVCDSTYLIDRETNISPKLAELEEILMEKLCIKETRKKVIIFSEWKTMLHLVEKMLKGHRIGYALLCGDVPVKNRGRLIDDFAQNPDALVFLSTESGGTGLNLQFADTVINVELPWNPARKNQRIGRINRLGQKSPKVTAINLVARRCIEERIADGIVLKESLFDAVLNKGSLTAQVDFSAKGRSAFIEQLKQMTKPFEEPPVEAELREPAPAAAAGVGGHPTVLAEESEESAATEKPPIPMESPAPPAPAVLPPELATTLNQGMQFLSGLFKMVTGKELLAEEQAISINAQTKEVTLKFKMPGF
jgi:superfamily II DNA or RNA helicase